MWKLWRDHRFPPLPSRCAGGDPTSSCETQGKAPGPLPCSQPVASRRKAVYLLSKPLLVLCIGSTGLWERTLLLWESWARVGAVGISSSDAV